MSTEPLHVVTMRRLVVVVLLTSFAFAAPLAAPVEARAAWFSITCTEARVAVEDPIVFPGRPGAGHQHTFFGTRAVRAGSTPATMRRGSSSCSSPSDTASYWAPSLVVGTRRVPGSFTVWYERAGKARAAAPPPGLKMIAGTPFPTGTQPLAHVSWQCVGATAATSSRHAAAPERCRRGQRLAAWVRFPDCWDGLRTDSPDHRSHMRYARRGTCPSSHPVPIMRLVYRITWPVRPLPSSIRLGGGMLGPDGLHADFWNTWRQRALEQLRWDCIEVAANCANVRR